MTRSTMPRLIQWAHDDYPRVRLASKQAPEWVCITVNIRESWPLQTIKVYKREVRQTYCQYSTSCCAEDRPTGSTAPK
jgi:hypothetical protein